MILNKLIISAAGVLFFLASAGAQDEEATALSPDKRFVFQFEDGQPDVPFGVFSRKSGKMVFKATDEANSSFVSTVRCLWAPDSRQFALNYRAGGRYNTTDIYRWDGKTFLKAPSFEEMLGARLQAEKAKDLKAQGIKADAYQRRIWDSYSTKRWIDVNTVEVDAYTIRAVATKEDDFADVAGSLRFVVHWDQRGKWVIVKQTPVSTEEMDKAN
ncbi:MAG: hypothetical protein WCS65_11470 [Verrucomicrobiae bacterium]